MQISLGIPTGQSKLVVLRTRKEIRNFLCMKPVDNCLGPILMMVLPKFLKFHLFLITYIYPFPISYFVLLCFDNTLKNVLLLPTVLELKFKISLT